MVTVRTVKLKNSWYNKKSSNTLRIGKHPKELLKQWIVNGTIRNGYKVDSTCHT